jgi:hypothetical protein
MAKIKSIQYFDDIENPHNPKIVSKIEHITIHFVCILLISFGLISADIIVINDIVIETYPAYDDGTPKYTCMVGQPEPSSESGRPRLIKIRYITAISNEPIFFTPYN